MAAHTSVEDYLADLPDASRAVLEELRTTIRAAAPEVGETISYDMPGCTVGGRLALSYGAFARHVSLFPASAGVREALGDELTPYLSGKGTIRFSLGDPLPVDLVTRIVRARLAEVAAGGR